MAFETEDTAVERGAAPETEGRPASTADYLLSAKSIAQKMVDRSRRQAEEILRGANTQAEEILNNANTQAEEILRGANTQAEEILNSANTQAEEILRDADARAGEITAEAEEHAEKLRAEARQDAEAVRSEEVQETVPLSAGDQEHAVRCVEACFEKLRRQHLDAIDQINAQWQEFLCGLYTGEETEEEVPGDLTDRVTAIAEAMDALDNGE